MLRIQYISRSSSQIMTKLSPLFLNHVSTGSLKDFIQNAPEVESNSKVEPLTDFPCLPCHTQAIKGVLKLVTKSVENICCSIARERYKN